MLPRSAGTETNCSAVSFIVPYTRAPDDWATGEGSGVTGIVTLARSSAVILIASRSLGFGIVPLLFGPWLRGGRCVRLVGIGCIRIGPLRTAVLSVSRLRDHLARPRIDQLTRTWIKQYRQDFNSRKKIP